MAQLSSDQKIAIIGNSVFQSRISQVLREKAQYWQNSATPNRADVNQRMQKRKRLAKSILQSSWISSYQYLVAQYWITQYTDDPAILDVDGIPTIAAISNSFDPTYDYWANVIIGDDTKTEIDW